LDRIACSFLTKLRFENKKSNYIHSKKLDAMAGFFIYS
ncbi:MAG: hypothetical protein ACI9SJ_001212, partial [Flavobacteriaceae bacterium]